MFSPQGSLDAVSFDTSHLHAAGEVEGRRVWFTPEGDALALYLFRKKPELPARFGSAEELRAHYARRLPEGGQVVEAELVTVDGVTGVWTILEVPPAPVASPRARRGTTCLASLTLPFEEFSLVLKLQCEERSAEDGPPGDPPVARARRELGRLRDTLRIDARVRAAKHHFRVQ